MSSQGSEDASVDGKGLYIVYYAESDNLPYIRQRFKSRPRRLYLHISVDCDQVHRRDFDGGEENPILIYAHAQSNLRITLFAKRLIREDICVATSEDIELQSLEADWPLIVMLKSCHPAAGTEYTCVALHIVAQQLEDIDMDNVAPPLSVPRKWEEMNRYVTLLINMGDLVADLDPIARAVMSLLEAGVDHLGERLRRDQAIHALFDEIATASQRLLEARDPRHMKSQPKQMMTRKQLLQEIYKALVLTQLLSRTSFVCRTTDDISTQVEQSRNRICTLMAEFERTGHVDMQDAVFRILESCEKSRLDMLPYAIGVQAGSTRECLAGTRIALLHDIEQWALSPTASRAYILYGAAGTGKSAVAHSVAIQLGNYGVFAPFFAFDKDNQGRSANQLFPSLAKALAERDESYASFLRGMQDSALSTRDIADQCQHLVLDALVACTFDMPVIFVVDALDECPYADAFAANERRNILRILSECLASPNLPWNVRFLITCRPDQDIRTHLVECLGADATCRTIDNAADTEADVRKYVESKLAYMGVPHLVENVTRASQTLFLCATVLCMEIGGINNPKAGSTLSPQKLVQCVRDHPRRPLYAAYKTILQNHFNVENEKDMAILRLVLAWVFTVRSPQPRCVFRDFAFVSGLGSLPSAEEVEAVFIGLGSLLTGTVDGDDEVVHPLHTTFRDFLLDTHESGVFAIGSAMAIAESQLAYVCLRVLNSRDIGLRFNICQLPTSFTLRDDIPDLEGRVEEYVSPVLQYACRAAAEHVLRMITDASGLDYNVAEELDFFLENQFLFWLETCSCLHLDHTGVFLRDLLQWTEVLANRAREETLTNFVKFESCFGEGIRLSPPQVYLSGLVLSPRASRVCQLYSHRFHHLAQAPLETRQEVWPAAEAAIIRSHSALMSVSCSPDGAYITAGCRDGLVQIWLAATTRQQHSLAGHKDIVRSIALSGDGRLVASGSDDETVRVWDASTGKQVLPPFMGHRGSVETVSFSPDGATIASGSDDKTVRLWSTSTGLQIGQPIRGHEGWVHSVAFFPDGKSVASSSADCTIRIWDVATHLPSRKPLEGHTDRVLSLAISPDGGRIASGSADHTILVWDTHDWQRAATALRGHRDRVLSVAFSPEGAYIASGSDDRTVRLWSAEFGQSLGVILRGHELSITSVTFSRDAHVVSASVDRTIRVWGTPEELCEAELVEPAGSCSDTAYLTADYDEDEAEEYEDWIIDDRDKAVQRPLLWVPRHLRRPHHPSAPGNNHRSLNIDVSGAAFGLEWAFIYKHGSSDVESARWSDSGCR